MLNDDQVTEVPCEEDAAQSVPAQWVRSQLAQIAKTARTEVEVIRHFEQVLRNYRAKIQEFAAACEKGAKEGEPLVPTIERARRAREQRLEQADKVVVAKQALIKAESVAAAETLRLHALIPWTDGLHVLRDRIDPDPESEPKRRR